MQKREKSLKTKNNLEKMSKEKASNEASKARKGNGSNKMSKMNRISKTRNTGITLIALVVTIVVLLILVGISITMLTGDNGLLTMATKAKEKTERTEVEEAVIMAYNSLYAEKFSNGGDTDVAVSEIASELTKQSYTIKSTTSKLTGATLTEGNEISVEKDKTQEVNIELQNEEGTYYYVEISGEYYEITKSGETVELASSPTTLTENTENIDYEIEVSTGDESIVTVTVDGMVATITGVARGSTTINVTVNGTTYEVASVSTKELQNVASINITEMTLDGASLITATLSDGTIATSSDVSWSSSDTSVATVTSNGIVKCGTKAGTATITCTGYGSSTLECEVTNTSSKIVFTNNRTENCTITGSTSDYAYNQPIIPVGFSAIDTIDAKWVTNGVQTDYNKGLVIMDEKGNQFVWVPVDGTNVKYEKWCTTNISYEDCLNDTLSDGKTTIASVDTTTTYGGFWIGRYEAGLDVDMGSSYQTSTSRDTTGTPITVEGAIPWNYISYTNVRKNAEYLNNKYVRSGLINGTQWDTTLNWLIATGNKTTSTLNDVSWGNYSDSSLSLDRYKWYSTTFGATWTACTDSGTYNWGVFRSGSSADSKALNISDLSGNLYEWTCEVRATGPILRRWVRRNGCRLQPVLQSEA